MIPFVEQPIPQTGPVAINRNEAVRFLLKHKKDTGIYQYNGKEFRFYSKNYRFTLDPLDALYLIATCMMVPSISVVFKRGVIWKVE